MDVLILAAGRGERLRPLTDSTPKPLLRVGDRSLIEHHITNLARAGFQEIVINLAYLGEQIEAALGNGSHYGVHIRYSHETGGPLETGGGIVNALPLLKSDPFLVINGDIWTDYDFSKLKDITDKAPKTDIHLILTTNPEHHPQGDFVLNSDSTVINPGKNQPTLTFTGIARYRKSAFANLPKEKFSVVPLLRKAADKGQVSGETFSGWWTDVGTQKRLIDLNSILDAG